MIRISRPVIVNNLTVQQDLTGFTNEMTAKGYIAGKNIQYIDRNGFGVTANANLIAQEAVQDNATAIYVIGTPIVIALHNLAPSMPVVFSLMTDPVGGGVVASLATPGGDFTGTSDALPAPVYFDTIQKLLPNCKNVGIIGNTGEENTQAQVKEFTTEAQKRGLTVTVVPTATTNNVVPAIKSLAGRVDCLLVGSDGTVDAAAPSAIQAANDAKLPFIMSDADYAAQGALVGIGADNTELGVKSADILIQVLNGASPANIPVINAENGAGYGFSINAKTAAALGITIPAGIGATIVGQ